MKKRKFLLISALTLCLMTTACSQAQNQTNTNTTVIPGQSETTTPTDKNPVVPTLPNNPSDTTKPSQTTKPTESTKPSQTTKPTESTKPSQTIKPTAPVNPEYDGYYSGVSGEGQQLKDSLHRIISKRVMTSYDDLWDIYASTDLRSDGKIMDIYSNITNFKPSDHKGNYHKEGDLYNREHTIPKSWWGGHKSNQGADPFIVLPSDGYINGMRSNYPFGEVKKVTKSSNEGYSKLGTSKYGGPSTVFEPADEWKGDMARIYFYATTCYSTDNWRDGNGSSVFTGNGNFGLTDYASKLFLKWHFQDPVSEWEMHRNNEIYKINENRNPYVDHPEFVELIWGTETF